MPINKAWQNINWSWIANKVVKNYWAEIWKQGILGLGTIGDPKEVDKKLSNIFDIIAKLVD